MKITFLGTGTSHGVPTIDCVINDFERCPKNVCMESKEDPKHNRTRSSILVEYRGKRVIVDVSADFREQALREKIPRIDAVLFTHHHADHVMGVPDIRSYTRTPNESLPAFGSEETIENIRRIFSYIFDPNTFIGGGIPSMTVEMVDGAFELFEKRIVPIPVEHGVLKGCYGYRIDNVAYLPDCKRIPSGSMKLLENLDLLILDCLRESPEHSTHMILSESLEVARLLRPKQCYFTHMCHDIHYKNDTYHLDPWMDFAWDGLQIKID